MAFAMVRRRTGRVRIRLAAIVLALAAPALAHSEAAETAAPEPASLADRAAAVLLRHCADCRTAHPAGDALDMGALANDMQLVVPGRPDASRAYQRLFAIERGTSGAPTPVEIEAVRDWIAALPPRDTTCQGRTRIAPEEAEMLIDRWTEATGIVEAADTRFLSLVHLWNACVPAERLARDRAAVTALVAMAAPNREPPRLETLGDASMLLVLRPSALGLTAEAWDALTAEAPRAMADVTPADWLAAEALSWAAKADPAARPLPDGPVERDIADLAYSWTQDVDLARAAAERGVTPQALAEALTALPAEWPFAPRRLLHDTLPRDAWNRLSRALDGHPAEGEDESTRVPDGEIDIVLWTDKPQYRPGDSLEIEVAASAPCHLTLIDVDQDGKALVLFPNEIEPDNLITGRGAVRVPGHEAAYTLRFDRAGEETIVAICQRNDRTPEGIAYDYEKQRFAALGDWRTFLRTAHEREAKKRSSDEPSPRNRRRGNGEAEAAEVERPIVAPDDPTEGRAAITLTIAP